MELLHVDDQLSGAASATSISSLLETSSQEKGYLLEAVKDEYLLEGLDGEEKYQTEPLNLKITKPILETAGVEGYKESMHSKDYFSCLSSLSHSPHSCSPERASYLQEGETSYLSLDPVTCLPSSAMAVTSTMKLSSHSCFYPQYTTSNHSDISMDDIVPLDLRLVPQREHESQQACSSTTTTEEQNEGSPEHLDVTLQEEKENITLYITPHSGYHHLTAVDDVDSSSAQTCSFSSGLLSTISQTVHTLMVPTASEELAVSSCSGGTSSSAKLSSRPTPEEEDVYWEPNPMQGVKREQRVVFKVNIYIDISIFEEYKYKFCFKQYLTIFCPISYVSTILNCFIINYLLINCE